MKRIVIVLFLWILIFFIAIQPFIYAEEQVGPPRMAVATSNENELNVFFDDRVFKGEDAKQETFFEIGKGQKVSEGSYIDLYFAHSSTILPDMSTINVLLDDIPLSSLALNESNINETNWRIDISKLGLKPGFHKITISPRLKVSTLGCDQPYTNSAWMVIYKKSKIILNLSKSYADSDFSWYPSPFIERGGVNPLHGIIVVPDKVENAEFKSAASLSQYFTSQAPGNRLNIPIYTESDVTDMLLQNNNVIWIGKQGRWKLKGKVAIDAMAKATNQSLVNQGYIGEVSSPWNANLTHLIVMGDDNQLANAATILTTESLYRQLQGNVFIVPNSLNKPESVQQVKMGSPYTVTLEKLGYNNLSLQGVISGSSQVNYTLPGNWDLADGARFYLSYSHSNAIIFNKSVMTVRLNGIPVESTKLVEKTVDKGGIDIYLDPNIIGASRTLSVQIDFEFVNPAEDVKPDQKAVCAETLLGDWAVIDKASSFTFTPIERKSSNLQSLPYPFVVEGNWDRTTFLTNQMSSRELNLAMTLIGRMGANGPGLEDLEIVETSSPDLATKLMNRNIIYIGTAEGIPQALNGFKDSFVSFSPEEVKTQSKQVELLDQLQSNSAIIQLTNSPLNTNNSLLLLTATLPERLASVSSVLTSSEESGKIAGRLVAVDNRNIVYAFPGTEDTAVLVEAKTNELTRRWSHFSLSGPQFIMIITLLMLVLYIIYRITRMQERSRR